MARNLFFVLGGGAAAIGVAVGGWMMTQMIGQQVEPATVTGARDATASAPQTAQPPAPAAPLAALPDQDPAPADEQIPATIAPSFDVVRISREGDALVAGAALPGAAITLKVDGQVVAQTAADSAGQFVAIFSLAPSDLPQVMTLEMADANGAVVVSPDQVILTPRPAPPLAVAALDAVTDVITPEAPIAATQAAETPVEETLVVQAPTTEAPTTETPTAEAPATEAAVETALGVEAPLRAETTPTQTETAPEPVATADAAPEPADEPVAPAQPTSEPTLALADAAPLETAPAAAPDDTPTAFLVRGDGQVQILDRAPQVMDNVVIDSISYSADGDVQISGRAADPAQGNDLRIYLNNQPIVTTELAAGDWATDLPNVDPGVYTLRVDQVAEGAVVSRFETPFQREAPEALAQARAAQPTATDATPSGGASLITVQPGHTLWAISRDRYGVGDLYVVIYRANRDQIRNPDLIYPGQVFALPEN